MGNLLVKSWKSNGEDKKGKKLKCLHIKLTGLKNATRVHCSDRDFNVTLWCSKVIEAVPKIW